MEPQALDSSDLVDSKAFFNAGFGFGHASVIAILLFLTRRAHLWSYREPAEGEVVEEELIVEKFATPSFSLFFFFFSTTIIKTAIKELKNFPKK